MRLNLPNQPQIDALSKALGDALRWLVSHINGWAKREHNGDGSHADVTAASLEVSGTTVLGKLNLRSVTYTDPAGLGGLVNNLAVAGLPEVSCLRIVPEANPLVVTGIDATGRTRGDLLLVLNCDYDLDPADIQLVGEDTRSIAQNRFVDTTASATGAGGTVTIQGARGLWLMYDYQERETNSTPLGARWRLVAWSA